MEERRQEALLASHEVPLKNVPSRGFAWALKWLVWIVDLLKKTPSNAFFWVVKSYRDKSVEWRKSHLQHFVDHAKGYAPTTLIALMALMLGGWEHHHRIAEFFVFTIATVSVEACFACQRAKEHRNKRLSRMGKLTRTDENDLGICKLIVGLVVCAWLLVAICEVGTMIQWKQLPEQSTWIAICLSGVNCAIAGRKMWNHAIELANEDFPLGLEDNRPPEAFPK